VSPLLYDQATSWSLIATTGEEFTSFSPYVASVTNDGRVAFQAALHDGGTGVFVGSGTELVVASDQPSGCKVTSHPDVNDAGWVSYYGELEGGSAGLLLQRENHLDVLVGAEHGFSSIGPAGPTMNEAGAVAFRAGRRDGTSGVYLRNPNGDLTVIAETGKRWVRFHGLPVAREDGGVVFRADMIDGRAGIYAAAEGLVQTVVETGERFGSLGRFPAVDPRGAVVFAATEASGGDAVVVTADGQAVTVVGESGAFASIRGVIPLGAGGYVRIATPRGGHLGLFSGPDPLHDRILAIGDPLLGSEVCDLAANPVSTSAAGHLAVRAVLTDGREVVLRADL
jgi:hypothetical protein